MSLRTCSCWQCAWSLPCSPDPTVASFSSLFQEVFSLILSTCPVYIYSCWTYLYGCFSGHVFTSTRNIETNSTWKHRSYIVTCVWHYAVFEEPFGSFYSTMAHVFYSTEVFCMWITGYVSLHLSWNQYVCWHLHVAMTVVLNLVNHGWETNGGRQGQRLRDRKCVQ